MNRLADLKDEEILYVLQADDIRHILETRNEATTLGAEHGTVKDKLLDVDKLMADPTFLADVKRDLKHRLGRSGYEHMDIAIGLALEEEA